MTDRIPPRLSTAAGPRGPLLVQGWQLFEKHALFNRERIPERVVHAKRSAAYGTFRATDDITPVFFVRDACTFPDFIHTRKRDPRTNLRSATAMRGFGSLDRPGSRSLSSSVRSACAGSDRRVIASVAYGPRRGS